MLHWNPKLTQERTKTPNALFTGNNNLNKIYFQSVEQVAQLLELCEDEGVTLPFGNEFYFNNGSAVVIGNGKVFGTHAEVRIRAATELGIPVPFQFNNQ